MRFSPRTNIAVIALESTVLLTLLVTLAPRLSPALNHVEKTITGAVSASPADAEKKYIKWVDFDVTSEAMKQAFRYDVDTVQSDIHLDWISLLAYLGARYGGDFSKYSSKDMAAIADRLLAGESMDDITADMKYYSYYLEAYTAVLGGLVGTYQVEIPATEAPAWVLEQAAGESPDTSTSVSDGCVWVTKYGLKGFSPIAKNYPYSDFDDFGVARSYGFKRQHLGHDMMGQVGTPVIAVESGYVEAIGWNQYGGWRLGIRSFDGKRYYYYAHLRKNYPYHKTLQEGSVVQAGDVIGYLGRTGYSRTENTNNIDEPHLHFGLQLIFDESQKEGNNEIWVNCYELTKFLAMNRSETIKNQETKEYYRVYQMKDPAVPGGAVEQRYQ
ncbi:MAG: M23 family metallopeptidase [Hungatella hathewayi]|nr:M23 family metallopeptidase [Hungatella hathewayi]